MMNRLWGFCDLENIGNVTKIEFSRYERLFLFVGKTQDIKPADTLLLTLCPHEIIQIDEVGKDYLDKILILHLGIQHSIAPTDVSFEIISRDKGYDAIRTSLDTMGRSITRNGSLRSKVEPNIAVFLKLFGLPQEKRPKQLSNLIAFIEHQMKPIGIEDDLFAINFLLTMVNFGCLVIEKAAAKDPYIQYCDPH